MTHHSFAMLSVDLVVGVTSKKAKKRGSARSGPPAKEPRKTQVQTPLRKKLRSLKFSRYDVRKVTIKRYKKLGSRKGTR